jgi:hypothetical protein
MDASVSRGPLMTPIWFESVWQDVRYAVDNLRRLPNTGIWPTT